MRQHQHTSSEDPEQVRPSESSTGGGGQDTVGMGISYSARALRAKLREMKKHMYEEEDQEARASWREILRMRGCSTVKVKLQPLRVLAMSKRCYRVINDLSEYEGERKEVRQNLEYLIALGDLMVTNAERRLTAKSVDERATRAAYVGGRRPLDYVLANALKPNAVIACLGNMHRTVERLMEVNERLGAAKVPSEVIVIIRELDPARRPLIVHRNNKGVDEVFKRLDSSLDSVHDKILNRVPLVTRP